MSLQTDTVITHPSVEFYDFYEAYDDPIAADRDAYVNSRSGILAQSAPNIGPVFFEEITGADGIVRQLQWTARVEASLDVNSTKAITMSQYLGRGAVSRGRMTISRSLNTVVSDVPYLKDEEDIEAVIKGIENLQKALEGVEGLVWEQPAPGVSAREYVENVSLDPTCHLSTSWSHADWVLRWSSRPPTAARTTGSVSPIHTRPFSSPISLLAERGANLEIGSCKIGTDDGRDGGTAVVDLDTKVYGTDNLFVVDASIFPGMVTANPSSYIMVVSEHAAEKILNLQ